MVAITKNFVSVRFFINVSKSPNVQNWAMPGIKCQHATTSNSDQDIFRPSHPSAQFIKIRHKSNVSEVFSSPRVFTQPRELLGGIVMLIYLLVSFSAFIVEWSLVQRIIYNHSILNKNL